MWKHLIRMGATVLIAGVGPAAWDASLLAQQPEIPQVIPGNQTLDGSVFGLAQDVLEFLENDRLLAKGTKIRLDRISSDGIPDGNYDQFFTNALERHLSGVIDERATLLLKFQYAYLESQSATNKGLRIIQLTAELKERGITKHTFKPREVNNTSDISRILGITLMPPVFEEKSSSSEDATPKVEKTNADRYRERLRATEAAMEHPAFDVVNRTQIAALDNATYTVEIRRKAGGQGDLLPVSPIDQQGLAFAPVEIGDTYQITLYNYARDYDAVARVEIDGLDVIHTFLEDRDPQGNTLNYPGYFIPRATDQGPGVHVVPGWLRTVQPGDTNVFDFTVNELGKGAASALKVQGKTGVISVRFFDACPEDGKLRSRSFGETGKGAARRQDYATIPVQVGSEPVAQISIRYSRSPK
jgi:hypothetical protein